MVTEGEFVGKKVLITGAAGGLGSALVNVFADGGASLVLCDRSTELLRDVSWPVHAFDLLDAASVEAAAGDILERHGAPDIVVNNAGWTRAETVAALTSENIASEITLNLTGVATFSSALLPAMSAKGSGAFVFVSSVNSISHFGNPAYAAAKSGINAFSRSIAVECGRKGIRSNVVCPGSIRTPAWAHRLEKDPGIMDKLQRLYPLGRIVEAQEVAEAVAFLASARASGITGTVLPVDGGVSAGMLPFIDDILGGS
ncbi:MAG: SDR family oxidoreductase [Rhizobiaceae bacterium]|nr:SDR family oxidoreductase [Rhizobiaceae bacterium]